MPHTKPTVDIRNIHKFRERIEHTFTAWRQENPAASLLTAIASLLSLYTFITMAIIVRRGYSVLPLADMWDYWTWYVRYQGHLISGLAVQHNEHRIIVARLFFLADQKFFQGRAIFIFVCTFLIQFFHAALLWWLSSTAQLNHSIKSAFLGATAFVCLFSAQQYSNFTWSFQIQFVAVYFATTAAMASLMVFAVRSRERISVPFHKRPALWFGATIFMGVVSTYSMANGLLVWPLLVLLASWLGVQWRERFVLGIVGIAIWALYLWGYTTPPQHSSLREALHNLPQTFAHAMCVLGSPLDSLLTAIHKIFSIGSENWEFFWTAVAGFVGLVTFFLFWGYFLQNRAHANPADGVILHMLLFLAATAFLIGVGRVNFPLREALSSRYCTPALLFWFGLLFLSFSYIERGSSEALRQSIGLFQFASVMILLLTIVLHQPSQIRYARDAAFYLIETEAAISAPVFDQQIWGRIYYNPKAMIPTVEYLRTNHLSVFAFERLGSIGDPITAHYNSVSSNACTGYLDEVRALPNSELPGYRIQGWGWDNRAKKVARGVVFTNGQDRIIGFGYTGFERPDVHAARPDIPSTAVGWEGYIAGLNSKRIRAYIVMGKDRSACFVGSGDAG